MLTKEFVTAGKAIFTVHNPTGTHFTYRVKSQPSLFNKNETVFMIGLLDGPDNTKNYKYVGMLNSNGTIRYTKKSKVDATELSAKVFNWAMKVVWQGKQNELPNGYGIKNEGKCGRCGRPLTTPESIDSGLGPECIKKVMK
jgi:hypothetical protein